MSNSKQLIDDILSGNAMDIENTFQSIMTDKVTERLDAFRKEVAGTLFKESEELDENIIEEGYGNFDIREPSEPHISRKHTYHGVALSKSRPGYVKVFPLDKEKEARKHAATQGLKSILKLDQNKAIMRESKELTDEQIMEDIMSLDELSKETLNNYINKSAFDHVKNTTRSMGKPMDTKKSFKNRILGIIRGKSRLTKEQVEIIESVLSE